MTKTNRRSNSRRRGTSLSTSLILSQANVRTVKTGVSIDELAGDIARRGLLQSLCVRPVDRPDGNETGIYEVPAGGRRYRALEKLVKDKRLARTAPVPCIVKGRRPRGGRLARREHAARGIAPGRSVPRLQDADRQGPERRGSRGALLRPLSVVKQRLRLAAVSDKLIDAYVADDMTLEQLMAFTVTGDHARQEQVWEQGQEQTTTTSLTTSAAS